MFETDDFDQVLSQFDFPELNNEASKDVNLLQAMVATTEEVQMPIKIKTAELSTLESPKLCNQDNVFKANNIVSPKHTKRKMIDTFFDSKSKRKFPGPAGLLTGTLQQTKDENICHMELLSQDLDFSQNNPKRDIFVSPIWERLLQDINNWPIGNVDTIKTIKQQALSGNLRRRKAQTVTAFVEAVDRSATDPLVILRDTSGTIKCTLHREAWLMFSPYIVSEYCALVLSRPTVLTTGGAFKRHYLNITLSNIYAIYSSAILKDETDEKPLPENYAKVYEEDFTIIKCSVSPSSHTDEFSRTSLENETNDNLLDGLDSSLFLDEMF